MSSCAMCARIVRQTGRITIGSALDGDERVVRAHALNGTGTGMDMGHGHGHRHGIVGPGVGKLLTSYL
jgi:hypothetical protein